MKRIYIITIILASFVLAWVMPEIYKMTTDEAPEYSMAYYSSIADKYCVFEFTDNGVRRTDIENNDYTQIQFDSLLPMIFCNQLAYDSRLPKKIKGIDIDIQKIRYENFSYRYKPSNYNKPSIKLYPLFESMSERLDLATPMDMFSLTDKIEFIDIQKNIVDVDKSNIYNKMLLNSGFVGPAQKICGIPSTRKNYDEGYFIVDANRALFHIKMVNGKAFIRNVGIDRSIKVEYFEATDYPNRKSYGFLYDTAGHMYVLSTLNYHLEKIEIPHLKMKESSVSIMANIFYWNITVSEDNCRISYAVDAKTKKYIDTYISENANMVDYFVENIMPIVVSFTSPKDGYVRLRLQDSYPIALLFNIFFVLTYLCIFRKRKLSYNIFPLLWIGLTGVYGFIACILFKSDIYN
jgi:hypothetical protein